MKIVMILTGFIIILSILSLAFSTAIKSEDHKVTLNNHTIAVDELIQLNTKENRITNVASVYLKTKEKDYTQKAKRHTRDTPNFLHANVQRFVRSIGNKGENQKNIYDELKAFNNVSINLDNKARNNLMKCEKWGKIQQTLCYFLILSSYRNMIFHIMHPLDYRGKSISQCYYYSSDEQQTKMIDLVLSLSEIRNQFLNSTNGIFCRKNFKEPLCSDLKEVNFIDIYKIKESEKKILNFGIVNDCGNNILRFLYALIEAHFSLLSECSLDNQNHEALKIVSIFISALDDLNFRNSLLTVHKDYEVNENCNQKIESTSHFTSCSLKRSDKFVTDLIHKLEDILIVYQDKGSNTTAESNVSNTAIKSDGSNTSVESDDEYMTTQNESLSDENNFIDRPIPFLIEKKPIK